jgi:hypothetical protein
MNESTNAGIFVFLSICVNSFIHNFIFSQVIVGVISGGLGSLLCFVIVILIVVTIKRKQRNKKRKVNSNKAYQSDSTLHDNTVKSLSLKPLSTSLTLGLHFLSFIYCFVDIVSFLFF